MKECLGGTAMFSKLFAPRVLFRIWYKYFLKWYALFTSFSYRAIADHHLDVHYLHHICVGMSDSSGTSRGQTGTNTLALCTYRFSHIVCHMRDAHHTKLSSLHSMPSWYTSISSHFTSIPISAAHHTYPAYHLSIVQHSRLTCNYRSAHLT